MRRLCEYRNIFGEPGTGVHAYRIFDIAIVDVILTIIGAILISWITGWKLWKVTLPCFLFGILMHWLFCVNTTVHKLIFGEEVYQN